MASNKTSVVYVKRVEDRDKKGDKVVIPAGTRAELTEAELKRVRHAVRLLSPKQVELAQSPKATAEAAGNGQSGD